MNESFNVLVIWIARVCHEANRAFCEAQGDNTHLPWNESSVWQKPSVYQGVCHVQANPTCSPAESHENWLKEKRSQGWTYGPLKDEEKKTHPCMKPYDELPPNQQVKDALFIAIVKALSGIET